jgi:hypothetical protein
MSDDLMFVAGTMAFYAILKIIDPFLLMFPCDLRFTVFMTRITGVRCESTGRRVAIRTCRWMIIVKSKILCVVVR